MKKAETNKEVRINNQKRIVNALFRYGPMTKQELAGRLELSQPTISVINKNLADKGLVMPGDKLESSGGRPPSHIRLVPNARYAIGINITSHNVQIVLINLGPEVICSTKYQLEYSATTVYWGKVKDLLSVFVIDNQIDTSILLGTGLSIQIPFEFGNAVKNRTTTVSLTSLKQIKDLLGDNIEIHNGVKMSSLAQVWVAGEEEDVIYLMLGNGVGGAIITERQILRSNSKNAEFGHMIIKDNGRPCSCGQQGCLDAYCSSRAINEQSGVSLDEFFTGLKKGHQMYKGIWEEYLYYLALAVNNLHLIFDTDIIIGGEMSPYINQYLPDLRLLAGRRNPFDGSGDYIRIGSYGEFDSAIGSALVHIDKFLS